MNHVIVIYRPMSLPRYTTEEMLRVDLEELTELENDEYDNFDDDTNYEPNDEENELDEDEGKSLANSFTVFLFNFQMRVCLRTTLKGILLNQIFPTGFICPFIFILIYCETSVGFE